MIRRMSIAAAALALAVTAAPPLTAAPPVKGTPGQAPGQATQMTIAAQDFNVQPGRNLQLALTLPSTQDALQLSDTAEVTVAIGMPLTERDQLGDAVNGVFGEIEDVITLPISGVPRTNSTLFIAVPTETGVKRINELRLPEQGLAPLRVELHDDGKPVAELVTFVHRDNAETETPLQIGLAVGTRATASLDSEGLPRVDETAIAELQRLTRVLESSTLPTLVGLEPSAIQALNRQRPDAYQALAAVTENRPIVSRPSLPLDPSGTANAGAIGLYQSWLTAGDAVTRSMLNANPERAVYFVSEPLTGGGAGLLADNGMQMLLTPADVFDQMANSPRGYYDPTKVVRATTTGESTVNIKVPDRRISSLIGHRSADPKLSAIRAVSELLMIRQISASTGSAGGIAVVVATEDLGLPDPTVLAEFSALVAATPAIAPVGFDALAANAAPMRVSGTEITVGFNAAMPFDVAQRIQTADAYRTRSNDIASMLPATDGRRQRWMQRLEQFPTSALSDGHAAQILAELDAEHRAVLDAVVPPAPFAVTLGGLEATLRVRVRNNSTTPLKIRLHMSSGAAKLTFPTNDMIAELTPMALTELEIPVEARSRGKFPIFVQVVTPGSATPIGGPVPLTARVNALSGFGNLITATLLIVLLLWWFQSWRSRRSKPSTTLPSP